MSAAAWILTAAEAARWSKKVRAAGKCGAIRKTTNLGHLVCDRLAGHEASAEDPRHMDQRHVVPWAVADDA